MSSIFQILEAEWRAYNLDSAQQLERQWFNAVARGTPIGIYSCIYIGGRSIMRRTAKIFMNNRSQAVRLPKEFQFKTQEVFIRKEGNELILSPKPTDWSSYLENGPVASDAFMEGIEDLPVQDREP